jgi:hypothetical protein
VIYQRKFSFSTSWVAREAFAGTFTLAPADAAFYLKSAGCLEHVVTEFRLCLHRHQYDMSGPELRLPVGNASALKLTRRGREQAQPASEAAVPVCLERLHGLRKSGGVPFAVASQKPLRQQER